MCLIRVNLEFCLLAAGFLNGGNHAFRSFRRNGCVQRADKGVNGNPGQIGGPLVEVGRDVLRSFPADSADNRRDGREVFHFPDGREKMLPVNSPLLFHLQRLRDEVHRYAIGAQLFEDPPSGDSRYSQWVEVPHWVNETTLHRYLDIRGSCKVRVVRGLDLCPPRLESLESLQLSRP